MVELDSEDIDATLEAVDKALNAIEFIDPHNCGDDLLSIAAFTVVDDLIGKLADVLSRHRLTDAQQATFAERVERYQALGVIGARACLVRYGAAPTPERRSN